MKIKYQKLHQKQLDQSDCGVTCLKTVLKSFKSDLSLEKLETLEGGGRGFGRLCGENITLLGGTYFKVCIFRLFWVRIGDPWTVNC